MELKSGAFSIVFFIILLIVSILTGCSSKSNSSEQGDEALSTYEQETSIEQARSYAENCLTEFSKNVETDDVFYYENVNALKLGEPYIIYQALKDNQDRLLNFPVYDCETNEVIYIIEAFQVDEKEEYFCNVSNNFVKTLNQLDYISNSDKIIAYEFDDTTYFDNGEGVYKGNVYYDDILNQYEWNDDEKLFLKKSFEEKKLLVQERIKLMKPYQTTQSTEG